MSSLHCEDKHQGGGQVHCEDRQQGGGQVFGMCQVCTVKIGIKVEARCFECVKSAL